MSLIKYLMRGYAVFVLVAVTVWATSSIGAASTCQPLSWGSAWGAISLIAVAMFVGFMAGRESKESK